jgi:hypothetical protein
LVAIGEMLLMSTTVLPADRPAATPAWPNSTCSTSGVSGSIRKMTSAFDATAVASAQATAPASRSAAGTDERVWTKSSCPAARRWPAMGAPMMPRPMNPSFMRDPLMVKVARFSGRAPGAWG